MSKPEGNFEYFIRFTLIISILHIAAIFLNVGTPFGLLYGPCIYLAHLTKNKRLPKPKIIILHGMPYIILAIWYLVLRSEMLPSTKWTAGLDIYYPVYFIFMVLSLLGYTLFIGTDKQKLPGHEIKEGIISQLCVINIIIGVLIFLLFLKMMTWINIELGFDPNFLVYSLLFVSTLLMGSYLYKEKNNELYKEKSSDGLFTHISSTITSVAAEERAEQRYQNFMLDEKLLHEYSVRVHAYFLESKLYLSSELSLDLLSKETGIPKHHFSQLFNIYIGKSFYQLIAGYRIAHAIRRIDGDGNITIESLAYECGFNSKTSFNKYFKDQTGYTPSEYRARRSDRIRS